MGNQDERLGSLLVFNDLALIISTYGVLLLFNYLVEPINANTWIVCTFFVGIKILIVGIADITGIGKNYIVSLLFVLFADIIIILINQLMAFGLSLRLMLIMVVADLICVFLAIFIWKHLGKGKTENYSTQQDWIYSEEPKTAVAPEPAVQAAGTVSVEDSGIEEALPEEEDVIFDFKSLQNEPTPSTSYDDKPIFDNFTTEPLDEGDDILSFDELTQELPSEEELEAALEQEKEEEPSFSYFNGLDIFNEFSEEPVEETSEPTFVTDYTEEESQEETSVEEPVKEESLVETQPEVEEEVLSEESKEPVIELEEEKEVEPVEEVPEPEEVETESIEEVETEPVEEAVEEPIEEEISEEVQEEVEEEEEISEPEITEPEEVEEESVEEEIPEEIVKPYVFDLSEFEEEEEAIPLFIQNANDYNRITNSTIGFRRRFSFIPVNVNQNQIDTFRAEVKEEISRLNTNLGTLAEEYNQSLPTSDQTGQIENFISLGEDFAVDQGEKVLRENLNKLTEKEFMSDQVVNTLLELISKLDNRIYNINFAEENLQERLLRDQQLEMERQERQKQAQERERLEKERRERERREQEREEAKVIKEEVKPEETKENPSINTNEVLLQNGDMDIIIDAADLELLKEFLQQQDNKN